MNRDVLRERGTRRVLAPRDSTVVEHGWHETIAPGRLSPASSPCPFMCLSRDAGRKSDAAAPVGRQRPDECFWPPASSPSTTNQPAAEPRYDRGGGNLLRQRVKLNSLTSELVAFIEQETSTDGVMRS